MNLNINATLDVVVDHATSRSPVDIESMLSFQRLRVYQRSIEFLALVLEIIGEIPKGHFKLADQLLRAASRSLAISPSVLAVARTWIKLASTRMHAALRWKRQPRWTPCES